LDSHVQHLEDFFVIGTNFTKADIATRSRFAVTRDMSEYLHSRVKEAGISDFLLLSTCNRTEFYTNAPFQHISELLCEVLNLEPGELDKYFYHLQGMDAVRHFFRVVSGLDSQILGDYEIVGQVKSALEESKRFGLMGTLGDRISNFAFQASKKIKNQTNISDGKYSVSYAAAELISHKIRKPSQYKLLIIGTGVFGSTVCRNLRQYFPDAELYLANRTANKSKVLASEIKAEVIPFSKFRENLGIYDAIIATTTAKNYLIRKEEAVRSNCQVFLDLSIPQAIDPEISSIPGVQLYTVDEVSDFHNTVLNHRQSEIPRAEKIIDDHLSSFREWYNVYYHRDIILEYKEMIENATAISDQSRKQANEIFTSLVKQIRTNGLVGCFLIEALNELIM